MAELLVLVEEKHMVAMQHLRPLGYDGHPVLETDYRIALESRAVCWTCPIVDRAVIHFLASGVSLARAFKVGNKRPTWDLWVSWVHEKSVN